MPGADLRPPPSPRYGGPSPNDMRCTGDLLDEIDVRLLDPIVVTPPGSHDAEPWRVALQAGPGTLTPLAVRTKRNAGKRGAPKPCSRPLSDNRHAAATAWDGKSKGVKGTLAALVAAPPVSHSEATDRPLQLSYPTPAPGPGRSCFGFGAKQRLSGCALARLGSIPRRVTGSIRSRPATLMKQSGPLRARNRRLKAACGAACTPMSLIHPALRDPTPGDKIARPPKTCPPTIRPVLRPHCGHNGR